MKTIKQQPVQDNYSQDSFQPTHSDLKKIYTFFMIREELLAESTSGLYNITEFRKACIRAVVNHNTARANFMFFQSVGLLIRNKSKKSIKINRLYGVAGSLYALFKRYQADIQNSVNPKVYFADLWKGCLVKRNMLRQAFREADNCLDKGNGRKLLRLVRDQKTPLGKKHGIHLSLNTIGKLIGRSKTTAYRSIERMRTAGIVNVEKRSGRLGPVSTLMYWKTIPELYGRTFVRGGVVYERFQNSYQTNYC